MSARNPTIHTEYLDDAETHLMVRVGMSGIERDDSCINLRADRGDKTVEVDYTVDVFEDRAVDTWGIVKDHVEGHLEAKLPHPEVVASWGGADDQVRRAFLPWVDEYGDQIGMCTG